MQENEYFLRISVKLNNPNTDIMCYWSLIKTLLNGKKVPCLPSVYDINTYVTDFKEKCQLFNLNFSEQHTLLKNISTMANTCSKHTNNILDTIAFSKEDIYKIIKNLDLNKGHGCDMISIRMRKLFSNSIWKLLETIFQNCLHLGKFSSELKKANVVPTCKKGDKQCIKIIVQFPFSSFAVKCLKGYFITTFFLSSKQSGFRPGDSCTNQLLMNFNPDPTKQAQEIIFSYKA